MPSHLSVSERANRVEMAVCSSARMLTANLLMVSQAGNALALRAMLNKTSGGSSDTELKELTVAPRRAPSSVKPVITTTPEANRPSASRKSRSEKARSNAVEASIMRSTSMPGGRIRHRYAAVRDLHRACRCGTVSASPDETRLAIGDDSADRRDVAIPDGIKRGVLRTAVGSVDQNDVGVATCRNAPTVQTVNPRIVTGRRSDGRFRRNVSEACQVGDRIEHPERHDAAPRRRVGRNQHAVERVILLRKSRREKRGTQVSGGANLQRDLAVTDKTLEIGVAHRGWTAVHMKRDMRPHRQEMLSGDGTRARNGRAAGMNRGDHAMRARGRHKRHIIKGAGKIAEAGLGQPDTVSLQLGEIFILEAGLENDLACVDRHA